MLKNISRRASCFVFLPVVLMLAASAAFAQIAQPDNNVEQAGGQLTSTVTASATAERVRFTSPNTVVQLRLEVYDEAGQKLLDTEQRGGNVLDWHLQGGAGERVADGVYLCVVTIKNLSGRLSQKLGWVTVSGQSTVVRSAAVAELSLRQAQTVGPVEIGEAGLTVLGADTQPVTVLANNGNEAQLARTRGALTFRVGDFFSGADKEQMRLTEEGNLGIGTKKPQAKLDVAGTIRAERMLIAKPTMPGSNTAQASDAAADSAQPLASGSGTQNRIAKWIDNAGTLGDSSITDTGGNVGIGTTSPTYKLVVGPDIGPGLTTSDLTVSRGAGQSVSAYVGASGSNGMNFGWDEANQRAFVNAPVQSPITFTHGGVSERMRIATNGNIGIGTTSPQDLLNVNGNLRWGGTITNFAYSGQDGGGLFLEQKGGSAATSNIRLQSSKSGNFTDYSQFVIDPNNGFSFITVGTGNGNVGIGTSTPQAKLEVRGDVKLGSSGQLFAPGGEENLRIIRGVIAGGTTIGIIAGEGFSVQLVSDGNYKITLDTCFNGLPAVIATADQGGAARTTTTQFVTSCSFQIHIENDARLNFAFIAIGPR